MNSYFESGFFDVERIMKAHLGDIIISKLICLLPLLSFMFSLPTGLILWVNNIVNDNKMDLFFCGSLLIIFLVYIRVGIDVVLFSFLIRNFYLYMGLLGVVWIILMKKMESVKGPVYYLTYKYQMSIAVTNSQDNIINAITFALISLCIHICMSGLIIYFNHKIIDT